MKEIKISILSKKWTVRIMSKKRYKRCNGKDSVAIANIHKRRIDLSPKGRDKETIVHELVHAYLAEMCTHSCDLDNDNLEEIFAELMARRGEEILKLSHTLLLRVSRLR